MKFHTIFLCGIFFLLQILPISKARDFHLREFGDPCGCGDNCLKTIDCIDSKCQCAQGLTYFPLYKECKLKVGSNCSGREKFKKCVKNAKCNQDKICECKPPSKPLPNGGCTGLYFDKCSTNHTCSEEEFLDCKTLESGVESCFCLQDTVTERNNKCVARIGSKCSLKEVDTKAPKCPKNSKCVDGRCRCEAGFKEGDGICLGEIGMPCEGNDCAKNLKCTGGVCSCSQTEVWNGIECRIKLGEVCGFYFENSDYCEDGNATCILPQDFVVKRCRCNGCWREENGKCLPPN